MWCPALTVLSAVIDVLRVGRCMCACGYDGGEKGGKGGCVCRTRDMAMNGRKRAAMMASVDCDRPIMQSGRQAKEWGCLAGLDRAGTERERESQEKWHIKRAETVRMLPRSVTITPFFLREMRQVRGCACFRAQRTRMRRGHGTRAHIYSYAHTHTGVGPDRDNEPVVDATCAFFGEPVEFHQTTLIRCPRLGRVAA